MFIRVGFQRRVVFNKVGGKNHSSTPTVQRGQYRALSAMRLLPEIINGRARLISPVG